MTLKVTSLALVGVDSDIRTIAQEAASKAFANAIVTEAASVEEALKIAPGPGVELILLANAGLDDAVRAVEAKDESGFPRWGVIVAGAELAGEGMEVVPAEKMSADFLAQVFKFAVVRCELRRENACLRGDLATLARRISHELRTPLGCILTTAELVNEILEEQVPDRAALTEPIIHSAHGMEKLVERVALLAKACATPNAREKFAMGPVFWAARQRLEGQISRKKASVAQPASWPEVEGMADWTEVVWHNLLANALQYGGKRIETGWRRQNNEYLFWIGDNGAGVPSERRSLLFQPFHSLHKTSAGRGLGLAIVQRLVERQGGGCGYEPQPDGGAWFFFTLPASDDSHSTKNPEQLPASGVRSPDQPAARETARATVNANR